MLEIAEKLHIGEKLGFHRGRRRPEQRELVKRNHEATVITPQDFMEDMRLLLPEAKNVDMMFMYSIPGEDQPLPQLAGLLKGVVDRNGVGSVRLSVSKNHLNRSEDKDEDANTDEVYADLREGGIVMDLTESQGKLGKLRHVPYLSKKGWMGNVHSKFVQIKTEDKVYTYLPEFNLTKRNMDQVNHAIRFIETVQDAEQEGSISNRVGEYMKMVREGEKFSDYYMDVDEELRFLADAGRFDNSVIRTTAWQEVMGPSEHDLALKNQYPPLGSLLRGIKRKAHQGKPTYVLLSADCRTKFFKENRLFQARIRKLRDKIHVRYALETEENPHGVVHSKNLISDAGIEMGTDGNVFVNPEAKKGKAVAQATSNNMTPAGYLFSTGEAGVLTRDQELVDKMAELFVEEFNNAV